MATYWPALDNGFIADDYVFLERVESWSQDPLFLYQIPPENFRTATYLEFLLLKRLAGYWAAPFYLFAIALHFSNCLLVRRLASQLTGSDTTGDLAAALFACFQNPAEAVAWLGGSHELPVALLLLGALVLWLADRWPWALLCYLLAMFAKETAPVLLPLLLLVDWWRGRRIDWRAHGCFWIATGAFALLFLSLLPDNSLVRGEFYAFGPHAIPVFWNSFAQLVFPWLVLGAGVAAWQGWRPRSRDWAAPLVWITVSLLPYTFLTYQNHVPSRHEYLPSVGVALAMALLLTRAISLRWAATLTVAYLAANLLYIALRKDAQFEERAAPTEQLVRFLESRPPTPIRVEDFPYNGWVAKLTTRRVPGWSPSLIHVIDTDPPCPACPTLSWDLDSGEYQIRPADTGN